jgi:uncharacterized coiled-coil protein SlyX
MLKDFLKYWLDIPEREDKLESIEDRLGSLEEKVEDQEELGMELNKLKQEFYDSRPVTSELSEKERNLLEIFLSREDQYLDKEIIAADLEISNQYAGVLVNRFSEKVDLEEKKVNEKGKKAWKLSKSVKERIEGGY